MKTTIQTVTPKQAAEWLDPQCNHTNRALRPSHVAFLAQEIRNGDWMVTHQGIALSRTGRLLDGQHRLAAIVQAGKAVQMSVSVDMDDEVFRAIDCGLKRANHDRIQLVHNRAQNMLICQAIRMFLWEIDSRSSKSIGVNQIEDEYLHKDAHWEWMAMEFETVNGKLRKASVLASIAVYHFVNAPKAEQFLRGYRDGVGLMAGCPELKLRNLSIMGTAQDVSYWRSQAVMRDHLHGKKEVNRVFEVSEDMLGNSNSVRVIQARSKKGVKSHATKRARVSA